MQAPDHSSARRPKATPVPARLLTILLCLTSLPLNAYAGDWTPEIIAPGDDKPFLPDFSYAGYHWGTKPLPELKPTLDATDFGVIPDDGKDDTAGLIKALEAAHKATGPVVLSLPKGRIVLEEVLFIERGNFVLQGRGSGPDGTIIEIPAHLGQMDLSREAQAFRQQKEWNDRTGRQQFSPFSWRGGVIWSRLPQRPEPDPITAVHTGRRGDFELTVESTDKLEAGGFYLLLRYDKGEPNSLFDHVYDHPGIEVGSWIKGRPVYETVTVASIDGNRVRVKAPLLHDVRPEWDAGLSPWPVLHEVGIEHLRIEFPTRKTYGGHHREAGFNAIFMTAVRHGWIRDVAIDNADAGILTGRCYNVTIKDVKVTEKIGAHYGIHVGWGQRVLVRDFDLDTRAIHTSSFNTGARASVFTTGRDRTAHLDQHCGINLQNLFDRIDVPDAEPGFSLFRHGGGAEFFPLHGGFNTFWNIRLKFEHPERLDPPVAIEGSSLPAPSARLIGIHANVPIEIVNYGPHAHIEGTGRDDLAVPSLYEYQLKQRR